MVIDMDLKLMELKEFTGEGNVEDLQEWIHQFEKLMDYKGFDEHKAFKVAHLKITRYASIWFESLRIKRIRDGDPRIDTWSELKRQIKKRFIPLEYLQEQFLKLNQIRQNTKSVAEYTKEFERLCILCELDEKEQMKIGQFITGLRPSIANKNKPTYNQPTQSSTTLSKFGPKPKPKVYISPEQPALAKKQCYKCQGFGHISRDCPQKVTISPKDHRTLLNFLAQQKDEEELCDTLCHEKEEESKEGESDFEDEEKWDDQELQEAAPDKDTLILGRLLRLESQPLKEEEEQRENLFYTRAFLNGRACNLIIDSGSCANVASSKMVNILKLPIRDHAKPYALNWLNDHVAIKRGSNQKYPPQDPTLTTLLKKYEDVFPDDLPPGLSPIRGIEHAIDLVPGATLPNKAAYGCNLEESKELKRQVQKLIDRGYIVSNEGVRVNPSKVQAILSWPEPKNTHDVRSFHGLASFYGRSIRNFSTMAAPLTELTKKGEFVWTNNVKRAFEELKASLCNSSILALPDFFKLFEVETDASGLGIGVVLRQEKCPIAFFSEKLNGDKLNYSTYDKEFYAIIRALEHWSHFLRPEPFVLRSDHESLKHIHGQQKLNVRHAKWVEFFQAFTFASKYKEGKENVVADALSRRGYLLAVMEARLLGFEILKQYYSNDHDFKEIIATPQGSYVIQDRFLFKENRLCVPKCSVRELLIREMHAGGITGHFGVHKTYDLLCEHFYWCKMLKDVHHGIERCATCQKAKSTFHKGLYTPLPVPSVPWDSVSMDLIVGLPRTT
ncbi:uncharacterized protein LOC109134920 [Beta vulgaris subsp. vulgaris]|uniref:uncharacterized protein LOC109134920 n=1 Tax=Beta vulgaris subsp. vulgaris TaxID=3555 RepID=UPI000900A704|nr:uncharacterized protein LOC109134920 [Beta vulgaris subsp. vulgaris]